MTADVTELDAEVVELNSRALALDTAERLRAYKPRTELERRMKVLNLLQLDRYLKADARARHPSA